MSALETINHFLSTKYPNLFLILLAGAFAWFATFHFKNVDDRMTSLDHRVAHIENVDLPEIRQDIKEIRVDISRLNDRVTRLEVKVDAMAEDIKELKADVKTILMIVSKK